MPSFVLLAPTLADVLDRPGYDDDNLSRVKLALAAVGIVALFWEASRESEGNPVSLRWRKAFGGLLAVAGFITYFQCFQVGYPQFYHRHEFFHYYVGAKYFKELGYENLYTCTAVAESQMPANFGGSNLPAGEREVRTRKIRDLRVNSMVDTTEWTAHPEKCTDRFTPERWESFKRDVGFFRKVMWGSYWRDAQKDHGYNPPPVWGVMGRFFAELRPATEGYCQLLSAIDPILFSAMFGLIAWAFGWRVMCIAVLFWGTQDASPFYWTGGAFLRQDWLFFAMVSACMIRKKKYFWGGAFLSYATMLRVFPIFFFLGWFVSAAAYAYRKRKAGVKFEPSLEGFRAMTDPKMRQIAAGAAIGAAVLFTVTIPVTGVGAWKEFAHHIAVHNSTPLTNHMGWKTIVAHSAEGRMQVAKDPRLEDPFDTWKSMRRERVKKLWYVYWGGIAAMMAAFTWACWKLKSHWIVQCLGCLPAMILVELTDYYDSFFIYGAMLAKGRRPIEIALIAAGALSQVAHLRYGYFDDRFVAMSIVFVALALFFVLMYSRNPWKKAAQQPALAPAELRPKLPRFGASARFADAGAGFAFFGMR